MLVIWDNSKPSRLDSPEGFYPHAPGYYRTVTLSKYWALQINHGTDSIVNYKVMSILYTLWYVSKYILGLQVIFNFKGFVLFLWLYCYMERHRRVLATARRLAYALTEPEPAVWVRFLGGQVNVCFESQTRLCMCLLIFMISLTRAKREILVQSY